MVAFICVFQRASGAVAYAGKAAVAVFIHPEKRCHCIFSTEKKTSFYKKIQRSLLWCVVPQNNSGRLSDVMLTQIVILNVKNCTFFTDLQTGGRPPA